jgi:transcriptional regulator with XRE-family HTH domain
LLKKDSESIIGNSKRKVVKRLIQITLKAARVNLGWTLKDAAPNFGIRHETLAKYEFDSTNVPRSFFSRVESVYGIPLENIYFGKLEDFDKKQVVLKHA